MTKYVTQVLLDDRNYTEFHAQDVLEIVNEIGWGKMLDSPTIERKLATFHKVSGGGYIAHTETGEFRIPRGRNTRVLIHPDGTETRHQNLAYAQVSAWYDVKRWTLEIEFEAEDLYELAQQVDYVQTSMASYGIYVDIPRPKEAS